MRTTEGWRTRGGLGAAAAAAAALTLPAGGPGSPILVGAAAEVWAVEAGVGQGTPQTSSSALRDGALALNREPARADGWAATGSPPTSVEGGPATLAGRTESSSWARSGASSVASACRPSAGGVT
jgi:hypothetical protein